MARAGLSPRVVVAEAARVADEVGLEQLTLATVAQRFGVALPSLYKHVDGADGLRRDLALLAVTELGAALQAAAVGKAGGDALRALAGAYREYARRHPGRYAATVRAPVAQDSEHVAASDAVVATVAAVLGGYGLPGSDVIHAIRFLRAALHGFVDLESRGGFGLPEDTDHSFMLLVDGLDRALADWSG